MPNNIIVLRKKIENLINKHFELNKLILIPGDPFWCNYLAYQWGIYILFSEQTFPPHIAYIGISSDIGQRLNSHFYNSEYGRKITSIGIIRLNNKPWHDGIIIEEYLINKFNPIYNKKNHYLSAESIPFYFNINEITSQIERFTNGKNP